MLDLPTFHHSSVHLFPSLLPARRCHEVSGIPLAFDLNLACSALGLSNHQDLFRMLINSLFWTVLGVIVVVLAI